MITRTKPLKRTAIKSTGWKRKPPKSRPKAKRRRSPNEFPDEVKAEVRRRSGNQCEIRADLVCTGRAAHFHHRKLRGHGDHRAVNCLHACVPCHDHVHGKDGRGSVGKSYLMGWLVRSTMDPAEIPVKRGGARLP